VSKAKPKAIPATHDIDQIGLISAIGRYLERHEGIKYVKPRHVNAVVQAANLIVSEHAREDRIASPGDGIQAWLDSDDRGMSSNYLAYVLSGCGGACELAWPLDAEDFGRCVRLLEVVPYLRSSLPMMAAKHEAWAKLVEAWDELETLYRAREMDRVSSRIEGILTWCRREGI